jgi:extradiol dioxygenase
MIKSLSYVGISSPAAETWHEFATEILGLQDVSDPAEGVVRLRMDDATWRIAVHAGETNALEYIGWDVGDQRGFDAVGVALGDNGVDLYPAEANLADERGVSALAWFLDPAGFRHEISFSRRKAETRFESAQGVDFVTGDNGLGHLVLMVPDMQAVSDFFLNVLGFRHSDDVEADAHIRFMHCNPRHHTLAFTQVPGHRGMHHMMLEVDSVDTVGLAYDRALAAQEPMAMTLGRHPNDMMTSFYVRTPSGFEIEFGSGGRLMDMQAAEPAGHYSQTSIWGHQPPEEPLFPGMLERISST